MALESRETLADHRLGCIACIPNNSIAEACPHTAAQPSSEAGSHTSTAVIGSQQRLCHSDPRPLRRACRLGLLSDGHRTRTNLARRQPRGAHHVNQKCRLRHRGLLPRLP